MISRIRSAASASGMWWIWMFWRVVMWPLFIGDPALDHVGELVHLLGRDAAERKLDADHLHVGLALAVDALLQAEADELLLGLLAAQEAGRLGVEVLELVLEDRDRVPRDVLVDLGVLERAALPFLPVWTLLRSWSSSGFCGLRVLVRCGDGLHVIGLLGDDVVGLASLAPAGPRKYQT